MIKRFRNKSLRALWQDELKGGINANHVRKLDRILDRLNEASKPEDMSLPGWRLHPLKGNLAGFWSVTVQANWRVIFRFEEGDATDVDYLDYH